LELEGLPRRGIKPVAVPFSHAQDIALGEAALLETARHWHHRFLSILVNHYPDGPLFVRARAEALQYRVQCKVTSDPGPFCAQLRPLVI
jgi:hypothetical protein